MRLKLDHQGNWSTIYTDGDPARMETAARYIVEAHEGEPLITIRGRDLLAIPTIEFYRDLVAHNTDGPGTIEGPVWEAVALDLQAFRSWQDENGPLLKLPDRPANYLNTYR